jgi:hypothetical protein
MAPTRAASSQNGGNKGKKREGDTWALLGVNFSERKIIV